MLQRIVLPILFFLLCSTVKAQTQRYYRANNSDSTQEMQGYLDYGARLYDVNKCYCPGVPEIDKDGHPLLVTLR